MTHVPVCIVGGGPVGMMLALQLSGFGVPCVLVNADADSQQQPRGNTHNARTMEIYRRFGLAAALRKLGLPSDYPTDVAYLTRLNGWELTRVVMPSEKEKMKAVRNAAVTDQIVEPLLRCNQMYVERYVLEHLRTLADVRLRFGWQCIGWTEAGEQVEVEIEEAGTGRREKFTCSYLVGCDGGQSFVRRKLGIHYSGEATHANKAYLSGAMVSTRIRIPRFTSRFPHKLGWQTWTLNAELRSNIISLNGDDEILMMSQLPSIDDQPDDQLIGQRLISAAGEDLDFSLIGHWKWIPGRALVADSYGRGRVLLAGDAVHLFTPTGGFGMNTGVSDTTNLAWKLAAVIQGWGGPALLPSYEIECRPIGLRNTGTARLYTNNVGKLEIPAEIEEDSPRGAAIREQIGHAAQDFREEFASIGIQLGARYDGSPIIVSDGAQPPPDHPFIYIPSGIPGGRAPHAWLPDRTSLFDHFGRGFTLLVMTGARADGSTVAKAAADRRIPLKLLKIDLPEVRDLYGADFALIRPDQHIAWRGNALPEDMPRILATVVGH